MTRGDWGGFLSVWAVIAAIVGFVVVGRERLVWQPKSALVNQAWGWVQGCTVMVPERGKNPDGQLKNVVWRTFPDGTIAQFEDSISDPATVVGLTVRTPGWPVDTIFIDETHQDTVWVLAHELLHHVLGNDDVWGSAHPFIPFAFPCHLMGFQQNGIGIMGQGQRRPPTRTP